MADNNALLLQVSADVRSLEKQMAKAQGIVDKSSRAMERRAQAAGTNLDKFFGQGARGANEFGRALGNVKTATLQQLAPGADRYATALGHLGTAGIAAGLAIAGVAAAFKGARNAAAFADDIADTAKRLHVTTDALQEYRFAIRAAGGEEEGADQALEAFSQTLGLAQAGLKKGQRGFKELGFTEAQIKGFKDADSALKAVTERIAGLSNVQKDAVIKQLGLDGLKPLIADGVTEMERLRAEAHKLGLVMDAELVKRGGELNDQFETVSRVIDVQLKSALVDLGPILVNLLGFMAQLAANAAAVADAFRAIEDRSTSTLLKNRQSFSKRADFLESIGLGGLAGHDQTRAAQALRTIMERELGRQPLGVGKPSRSLIPSAGKTGAGPRDDTAQRIESVNAAVADAARALLEAQGRLTENIEDRAALEKQIAEEELTAQLARIAKQKADLAADKGFSGDKALQQARLDEAANSLRKAALVKQDLIAREADFAAEDRADETRKAIREAEFNRLQELADQATTAKERTRIEREILRLKQIEAQHEKAKELSRLEQTGTISDDEGAKRFQAFLQDQGTDRGAFAADHKSPVQKYLDSIQDLNTTMEEAGVRAVDSLADGLADAILGAKSLGDVARNVFQQIASEILSATIKKAIVTPLLGAIGLADGGLVQGPGTGRSDSVPAMLSNGEFVVNANAASRNLGLLKHLNAGFTSHGAAAPTSIRHGDVHVMMTVNASDAPSFRRSEAQITSDLRRRIATVSRRGLA